MELISYVQEPVASQSWAVLPLIESNLRRVQDGGIREALQSLQSAAEALRQCGDARAIFPDIYSVITENVSKAITRGFFQAPDFISRLAGCFASLYLDSLARSLTGRPQQGSAWALAYSRAGAENALPVEHAALGISAHINFDLTLGIYQVIQRLGATSDPAALAKFKHDHDAVNVLLEESLPECLLRLTHIYGCPATPMLTGRLRRLASRWILGMLRRWRDHVWDNVLELLAAPTPSARQEVLARMERTSLREGQKLSKLCRASRMLVH